MESFEVWEMVAILFIVISPWFQSFVEFILEIVCCFVHFYIMKNVDAIIDAFVPLFTYIVEFYITKTGIKNLRFIMLLGENLLQKFITPNTVNTLKSYHDLKVLLSISVWTVRYIV